jgi:perosamine synthetase
MERIPVAGPWITEREQRYVADAAAGDWYADAGRYTGRFERAMAEHCARRYACALPSCTSALHLSLAALGVGPGDEVIVPDVTWIASAAPVQYVGATAVFADIDPDSWCVSAQTVEACITPRTRALIVVDLYGQMPGFDELLALCARRGIAVIEDSAEAVGAMYNGRPAGSFGLASCFSFHGSKTITTGEGGMLLTDDRAFFDRVLVLRDHGRLPGDRYFFNSEVAFKYKMSSVQAALGLAQIERVGEIIARKREIFEWYRQGLSHLPGVRLNPHTPGVQPGYWMVSPVWGEGVGVHKRDMMTALESIGIDTRPFFHPLSTIPAYQAGAQAAAARARNTVGASISSRAINLPSALCLTRPQVQRVCEGFTRCLDQLAGARAGSAS